MPTGPVGFDRNKMLNSEQSFGYLSLNEDLLSKNVLVHLDYWWDGERIHPVVIRIYDHSKAVLAVCVYDVPYEVQQEARVAYAFKAERPFWIDYIGDCEYALTIALGNCFDAIPVTFISQDTVLYLLALQPVILYVAQNHIPFLEHHFGFQVIKAVHYKYVQASRIDYYMATYKPQLTHAQKPKIKVDLTQ